MERGKVMGRLKGDLLFVLVAVICCVCLFKGDVKAANVDFSKEYSGEYCGYEEYRFKLGYKCRMTIYMEYTEDEESYEGMSVTIYDDEDFPEFDKYMFSTGDYQKTITLSPGKYTLEVESDGAYYIELEGEYYPEISQKNITLQEGKSKALKVNGSDKKVKWSSSNKSIASVNSKGVVKAKKAGKATITAKCGGHSLKCKVTVEKKPVSYKTIEKKMKDFARKNGGFEFKNIDVGNKCRVYGTKTMGMYDSKIESEGFFMIWTHRPYFELVKKRNGAEMRLRMDGELKEISITSTSLYCNGYYFSTSNRRLHFPMKHTSGNNIYNYSTSLYEGKMKGYASIHISSQKNISNLKKFETMLGQASFNIKITDINGAYMSGGIPADTRSNWRKLVKEYRALLKEY